MLFTDERYGSPFAKDPAVVRFGGRYILYYSTGGQGPDGRFHLGVGIAISHDMESWAIQEPLPLTQPCERNGIGAPGAIVLRGQVHLFYQTYGNAEKDAICHAVSGDGIHFIKDASNPVYRPSADWCCGRAIDADVIEWEGKLFLYIATRDHDFRIQKLGAAYADIDSDFSRGAWKHAAAHSILTPEMKWEQECIEAPATLAHGGALYLFYGGAYNCKPQQIGCAVSLDGVRFERLSPEPLLGPGPSGAWNASESGHPYAFQDEDGCDYLFYQGSPDGGKTWRLSRARISWDGKIPSICPLPL